MAEELDRPRRAAVRGVAELVRELAQTLTERFGLVTVRGEISGWSRASSGHSYFTLKDVEGEAASLRCAMFRRAASWLDFTPRDGLQVEVRGRVGVYEPRGELQFVVEAMRQAGDGALHEQFLRLKAQLGAQGLFDSERKRRLPPHPRTIGVVTSLAGAALHDVVTALARRSPHVGVVVYPSLVQGPEAPAAVCAALRVAARRAEVDVLLVCRGGGSLEDLWAFNDERVVRAIVAMPMPVVCGVGHESDITLADLAADLRAPTPTAAAELAAPVTRECLERLAVLAEALRQRTQRALDQRAQTLDRAAVRLLRPSQGVHVQARRLAQLAQRLQARMRRPLDAANRQLAEQAGHLQRATTRPLREARAHLPRQAGHLQRAAALSLAVQRQRLDGLAGRLNALDPGRVLQRGYAWLTDAQGRAVVSAADLHVGDRIEAVLADGRAGVTVDRVAPTMDSNPHS